MEKAGDGGSAAAPGKLWTKVALLGCAVAALQLAGGCPSRGIEEQQPAPATQRAVAPQPGAPAAGPVPAPEPAAAERVWVEKQLSGGRQCEPPAPGEASPPSLVEVKAQLTVPVHDARREQLPVAMVCGGAAWAYSYQLLIDRQDLPAVRQAGFAPRP